MPHRLPAVRRLVTLSAAALCVLPALAFAQGAPPPRPGAAAAPPADAPGAPAPAPDAAAATMPGTAGMDGMHGPAMMGEHHGQHGAACPMCQHHMAAGGCDHCMKGEGMGQDQGCCGGWPKITVSPGLQMWTAIASTETGELSNPNVMGAVLKAQVTLTDMIAVHLRGAYGWNTIDTPLVKRDVSAWMAGAGLDMYFALGRKVLWYNTMGLGFQQAKLTETGKSHPTINNPGAYFITTLDITMFGNVGMWMDWGCGVVGPAFGDLPGGQSVKTWHINPLGAGGFRFGF